MSISVKLAKLTKQWKNAQPISPSFNTVPDGDYVAKLNSMTLEESKKSGRLQVVSEFEIVDGEHEGQTVRKFDGINNEQEMGWFKGYCDIIGFEVPKDLTDLESEMSGFVENNSDLFNIRLKTGNSGYQNLYVQGVSEYTMGEDEEAEEAEEEEPEEAEEAEEEEPEEEPEEEVKPKVKKIIKSKRK